MISLITAPGVEGGPFDAEGVALLNLGEEATQSDLRVEELRLVSEWEGKQYARNRAEVYPSLADQADMQFHDLVNNTTTWLDAISAVKDLYPKPQEE